jgi:hypothetical protein
MDMQEMARTQALLLETTQAQKKLLEQSAMLMESHKRENAQLRSQLMQATAHLQQATQQLELGGQRFGVDAMKLIGDGTRKVLMENAAQAMDQVHRQTEVTSQRLTAAAETAREQSRQLNRAQTTMVWKSLIFMAVGALLLVGGSSLWAWTSSKEALRYRVEADLGRRVSQADLVKCGEGLCANVDGKGQRLGDKQQYAPVRLR